jgi:hypothetical protein
MNLPQANPLAVGQWHTSRESIHQSGELGCSLSHAFEAAFDNPDLMVAFIIGEGGSSRLYAHAETQPRRPPALVNLIMEKDAAYFILFALPRTAIRADVIEFFPATPTNLG